MELMHDARLVEGSSFRSPGKLGKRIRSEALLAFIPDAHRGATQRTNKTARGALSRDEILRENLCLVFNEHDHDTRMAAMLALWTPTPVFYQKSGGVAGVHAVSSAIGDLVDSRAGVPLVASAGVVGHNGAFLMRWRTMPKHGLQERSGTHLALFSGEKIDSLYDLEDRID